jgi:hypothetical protein
MMIGVGNLHIQIHTNHSYINTYRQTNSLIPQHAWNAVEDVLVVHDMKCTPGMRRVSNVNPCRESLHLGRGSFTGGDERLTTEGLSHLTDFIFEHTRPHILGAIVVDDHGGLAVAVKAGVLDVRLCVELHCVV